MEDVLELYAQPPDPLEPVICFDEACKQLFGEVRPPQPPRRGAPARVDYEYERKGVCHQLLPCEPLRGWRHVRVSERRTRRDDARCVRDLVDVHYPRAQKVRMVRDKLNTHDGASLYERLGARRTHAEAGEVGIDRVDRRPQSELEQRWAIQIGREGLPDEADRFAQPPALLLELLESALELTGHLVELLAQRRKLVPAFDGHP